MEQDSVQVRNNSSDNLDCVLFKGCRNLTNRVSSPSIFMCRCFCFLPVAHSTCLLHLEFTFFFYYYSLPTFELTYRECPCLLSNFGTFAYRLNTTNLPREKQYLEITEVNQRELYLQTHFCNCLFLVWFFGQHVAICLRPPKERGRSHDGISTI